MFFGHVLDTFQEVEKVMNILHADPLSMFVNAKRMVEKIEWIEWWTKMTSEFLGIFWMLFTPD